MTKNTDPDKYSCSGYDISFDKRVLFSLSKVGFGKNIIFGADISSFLHVDDMKKIS